MTRLSANLEASITEHPRPLLVLYANAQALEPLRAKGLSVVHATPTLTVLATSV